MLSDFGGLFEPFVITFFSIVGAWVNKHYIMGKFIRSLYYTIDIDDISKLKNDESQLIKVMKAIKFTGIQKFWLMLKICTKKK